MHAFAHQCLGHCLTYRGEDIVLMGWTLEGIEFEPRAKTNIALVLPQDYAAEAPHDYGMVYVVPGVPDGQIMDHMMVCPKDVVHTRPHLLDVTVHDPHPDIPRLQKLAREEVLHNVLDYLCRHFCRNCLFTFVAVQ